MDILPLLDELQTIARNGLAYAANPYDRERYERLLVLATTHYGRLLDVPPGDLRQRFAAELGIVTPKVGADGAIFAPDGQILLLRRTDDGRWCLPCGWVEPNESPAEAAVRETKEETGLDVRPRRLVDVFTRWPSIEHGPHTVVAVVYLCEITGGTIRGSHEGEEVRFWPISEVPAWHGLHYHYATEAYAMWQEQSNNQQE